MEVTTLRGEMNNSLYVAQYHDGRVLILDGGCAGDHARVEALLSHSPTLVVCTHAHPDHMGAAGIWTDAGVPVACPVGANKWYSGPSGFLQHRIEMMIASYARVSEAGKPLSSRILGAFISFLVPPKSIFYPRVSAIDIEIHVDPLAPGKQLDAPQALSAVFPDWAVVAVPGHTCHMIALWHEATGTLYAADVLIRRGGKLQSPIKVDFPSLQV